MAITEVPGDDVAKYVVVAPLAVIRCRGNVIYCHQGDRVPPDADWRHVRQLLADGMIEKGSRA